VSTSASLRVINQARVLATLRRPGPWSRAELASALGITRSTVTVVVAALLEQGLVHEVGAAARDQASTGRPRVQVALRGEGGCFAGLALGNDDLVVQLIDLTGRRIDRAVEPVDAAAGPAHSEERLIALLRGLVARHPGIPLRGIGLTMPGLVDNDGVLEWAPLLRWRHARMGERVRAAFGVPVRVENDANAAAIGEAFFGHDSDGAGARHDDLLYLVLDAGIGAGVLMGDTPYRGAAGHLGEVGHIRVRDRAGSWASVEDVLGKHTVLAEFARADRVAGDGGSEPTLDALLAAIADGSPAALAIRDAWQDALGWLVSTLVWTLDPGTVVFGGPLAALLKDDRALRAALRDHGVASATTLFRVSPQAEEAVETGAAALPMRHFFAIPELGRDSPTDFPMERAIS
jgi:predicted NBD/HSP70 family sugar kinase